MAHQTAIGVCLLTIACVTLCATSVSGAPQLVTIHTPQGPVTGQTEGEANDVTVFKGIPFAAPPVGPLRWKSPAPASNWTEPRNATYYRPRCAQPAGGSEDCLYVNVWTPTPMPKKLLPVYLYIYGQ
jgi:para-nitrobenzyl esterase